MDLKGSATEILDLLIRRQPIVGVWLGQARKSIPRCKREVSTYQAAALAVLVSKFNSPGDHILEIGTALGYTAAVMAEAAPKASITTLNPKESEFLKAVENLKVYGNVTLVQAYSWGYLADYKGPKLSVVFVDGDHGQVERDFPWFDWLKVGGLVVFHDYSPEGSWRPCSSVLQAINKFRTALGRGFDVSIIDGHGVGMVGWYRREGEKYAL